MMSLLRPLVAIALAVWLALPLVGNEGGDNASGTGIWILPRATFLASGMSQAAPRATKELLAIGQDVVMEVSSECGACSATFVTWYPVGSSPHSRHSTQNDVNTAG